VDVVGPTEPTFDHKTSALVSRDEDTDFLEVGGLTSNEERRGDRGVVREDVPGQP